MVELCQMVEEMVEDMGKELGINIIKFQTIDPMNIPTDKEIGVYFIFTIKGTYIGSSINIFKRLKSNIRDGNLCKKNLEIIRSVHVCITNREEDARILEYALLDKIKPRLNIKKGFESEIHDYRENWNFGMKKPMEKPSGIWRPKVWRRYKKLNII